MYAPCSQESSSKEREGGERKEWGALADKWPSLYTFSAGSLPRELNIHVIALLIVKQKGRHSGNVIGSTFGAWRSRLRGASPTSGW